MSQARKHVKTIEVNGHEAQVFITGNRVEIGWDDQEAIGTGIDPAVIADSETDRSLDMKGFKVGFQEIE